MKAVACCFGAVLGAICSLSVLAQTEPPKTSPVAVTDRDRAFLNYVREPATVGDGVLRLEVRGFHSEDNDNAQIDVTGFSLEPFRRDQENLTFSETEERDTNFDGFPDQTVETVDTVDSVSVAGVTGGFISFLGSFGLGENAEVGFDIPFYFHKVRVQRNFTSEAFDVTSEDNRIPLPDETMMFSDIVATSDSDIGDMTLYAKFKYAVAENCRIGGGVEITPPTGPERKRLGTGELGLNPFVGTRYQNGKIGAEMHVGWFLYTDDVPDVFNYSATVFVRPAAIYGLRLELSGRHFSDFGEKLDDVVMLPGIDFDVTDYLTVRPVGMFNLTSESEDWGIGIGIAARVPVL